MAFGTRYIRKFLPIEGMRDGTVGIAACEDVEIMLVFGDGRKTHFCLA